MLPGTFAIEHHPKINISIINHLKKEQENVTEEIESVKRASSQILQDRQSQIYRIKRRG